MKKTIRLFLLLPGLLLVFTTAKGQTNMYHPFPEGNAIWVGHYWPGLILCHEKYSYYIGGDTLIGGFQYHKLMIPFVDAEGMCFVNHSAGYNGCFRNDQPGKKVYYVAPGSPTEELLYDFNLQVGDTIPGFSRYGCFQPTDTITQIDSIFIGSGYRKAWHFGSFPLTNTIVEGMGYISGILEGCAHSMPDGPFYVLDCFQQNGKTLYPDTSASCELLLEVSRPDLPSPGITVSPNPFSFSTTVTSVQSIENGSITIYNSGMQIVRQTGNISGKVFTLHRENLPSGVYFIRLMEEGKIHPMRKIVIGD